MLSEAGWRVLAKRPKVRERPEEPETLVGHSTAVLRAFVRMFGRDANPTRLGEKWLRFFRLDADTYVTFQRNAVAACVLHDLGKANSGFQAAVKGERDAQVIRHEHLSALLLALPTIDRWLGLVGGIDRDILIPAVAGHHLRASRETFAEPLSADRTLFSIDADGIYPVLNLLSGVLEAEPALLEGPGQRWTFGPRAGFSDLTPLADGLRRHWDTLRRALRNNQQPDRLHLLLAVRAALILADSAGSGLVREGKAIEDWLGSAFDEKQLADGQSVESKVITPRIEELKRKQPPWADWHDFQNAAEKLPERTLMLAPCGSGKTLAAWRWVKAQAAQKPVARVIFLYPTRGTATEGFRDYVSWAPEADAALVHGTSEYELQGMFEDVKDSRCDKDFTTEDRLYALTYWQRRMFSATVDQFLGFMQHSYRSTCLMPLLADSVVVVDEVHSFDKSLFSALRRFLKEFDVPVLCMTASLPAQRIEDLKECGLTVFPEGLTRYADLKAKAERPRYAVSCLPDATSAEKAARDAFARGKRVLWVVNTVDRCQSLARKLNALCYHSRFKLEHRKERHKQAVEAFKFGSPAVMAVTTQVCEMSLDLDADELISEYAPVTSLIQRMGRCNRHDAPGDDRTGLVFLYQPESEKPYDKDDLVGLEGFVSALDGKSASQSRLQELLEQYGSTEVEVDLYAAFLESGPWAQSREESLREGQDYTVDAILDGDIAEFKRLRQSDEPTDGLVVPIPRRFAQPDSRVGPRLRTAPADHYNERWGFMEKPHGKDET